MLVNSCASCLHWRLNSPLSGKPAGSGQCQRFPPNTILVPIQNAPQILSIFPTTMETEFCGEYEEEMIRLNISPTN
jgi:hypothetical protein